MIEFPILCYLFVCLINIISDEKNGLLWCLFGIYLLLPTPQFFLQDAQLFLVYSYITQSLLFILTLWLIKDIKYRIILSLIMILNLLNLFVFLYPLIFPSITSLFLFTTNRIYFETLLCLTNFKTNKDNKSISLTKNRILQIICFGLIAISYIGV